MKRKRCTKKNANDYIFRLSGSNRLYFKSETVIDFTPLKDTQPKNSKDLHTINICPRVNIDGKYYTPGFKLPCMKGDSDQQLLMQHKKKVYQYQHGIQEIFVPKPRSKNKYCGVCKDYYQQYLDHIESIDHKTNLRSSSIQRQINWFCFKFQKSLSNQSQYIEVSSSSSQITSIKQDIDMTKTSSNFQPTQVENNMKKEQFHNIINLD